MDKFFGMLDGQKAKAVLLLRVVTGVILIVSGYQKLFIFTFGGVTEFFESIALPLAPVLGTLVPLLEFFGGIGILLGVFTRLISIWIIVQFTLLTIWVLPVLMSKGWGDVRLELVLAAMGV